MTAMIAIEAIIILLLVYALLAGQPAALAADRSLIKSQATELAIYKARPTPFVIPTPRVR